MLPIHSQVCSLPRIGYSREVLLKLRRPSTCTWCNNSLQEEVIIPLGKCPCCGWLLAEQRQASCSTYSFPSNNQSCGEQLAGIGKQAGGGQAALFQGLYLNARSIPKHVAEIWDLLDEAKPDMCLFTETWLNKDATPVLTLAFLTEYSVVRLDRIGKRGGGLAIATRPPFSIRT